MAGFKAITLLNERLTPFPRIALMRRELPDMQTGKKGAKIAHLVSGQRFFDPGKTGIGEVRKRQRACRAHRRHADQKRKQFGHGNPGGGLHRAWVEPQAAAATNIRMNDEPCVTQGAEVTQDGAAGCAHLGRQIINRCCACAAQGAHDGVMSEAYGHFRSLA